MFTLQSSRNSETESEQRDEAMLEATGTCDACSCSTEFGCSPPAAWWGMQKEVFVSTNQLFAQKEQTLSLTHLVFWSIYSYTSA
jgi:hypothetical protein